MLQYTQAACSAAAHQSCQGTANLLSRQTTLGVLGVQCDATGRRHLQPCCSEVSNTPGEDSAHQGGHMSH